MKRGLIPFAGVLLAVAACGSESDPPVEGVDVPDGPCGHALYVVSSDYVGSSSVAVVGWNGEVLAGSIVNSGSSQGNLSLGLSGDVAVPTARTRRGSILLVDRYPAGVVTILDPVTATVTRQISVKTGFPSNPQDVLEVGDDELWVTRYDRNPDPGREPFDEGSDILVVGSSTGDVLERIDLDAAMDGAEDSILPRPSRLLHAGDHVLVLLSAYSVDFSTSDDGRLALVDPSTRAIDDVLVLEGARGCYGLALSPSGERAAIGCSGTFGGTSTPSLDDSAVIVVRLGDLSIERTLMAADLGEDPIGPSLAFSSEDTILVGTFGTLDAKGDQERPDRLVEVDVTTGDARSILLSETKPFSIGDVRCEAQCGACFVADADRVVVHRIGVEDGAAGTTQAIPLDDGIGLPPRTIGAY